MIEPPRDTMPVMRFAVMRNIGEPHAGMDREVVDALLRLLDQGVAKNFPGKVFRLAVDFFQRLINRNGADGHRASCG